MGTELPAAEAAAERLRRAIAAAQVKIEGGAEISVTVSIGLAQASATKPPDELVRAADRALYAAKSGGRNRIVSEETTGTGPLATAERA